MNNRRALWLLTSIGLLACVPSTLGGQGTGPGVLEDCTQLRWVGAPAPSLTRYSPPVGVPRAAIALSVSTRSSRTWTKPAELDLSRAEALAVRVHSPFCATAGLSLQSGAGSYSRDFDVVKGEQIVLLRTGSFRRARGADGWDRVSGLALTLRDPEGSGTIRLLRIRSLTGEYRPEDGALALLHPASRVRRQGVAFPLYALVDGGEYAKGRNAFSLALQRYLTRLTGATVPLNPDGLDVTLELTNVVLLGRRSATAAGQVTDAELDAWGYQGFVIKARSATVSIAGKTRHGVGYGLYRFLEQQGCRFYAANCETVPEKGDGILLDCELADKPFMDVKGCTGTYAVRGWQSSLLGDPRGTDDPPLTDKTQWIDHTAAYLVPKSVYYDTKPEYFAELASGKRMPRDNPDVRVMICLTHPDVLRISAERAVRWIGLQEDRKVFVVAQGDGVEWCHCPRCTEVGNRADQTLYWVNHVAREVARLYPDKVLMSHAYNGSEAPPLHLGPEKNVVITYAAWPNAGNAPNSLGDFDARENTVAGTHLRGWLRVAPGQMGLYDYNSGGRLTLYGMARRIKWMAKHDMHAVWYCGTPWFFRDMFLFVHCRLSWDPYEDVTSLRNEFIRAYYGPAAAVVQELCDLTYFRLEYGDYGGRMRAGGYPPADYFDPPFVNQALALFDRALALTESIEQARRDLLKTKELFIENCFAVRPSLAGQLTDDEYRVFGRNLDEYMKSVWLPKYREDMAAFRSGKSGKPPAFDDLKAKLWSLAYVDVGESPGDGRLPPLVTEMVRDPKRVVEEHRRTYFVEETEDGWRLPGIQFRGGQYWRSYSWQCPRREHCMVIRGRMTDVSEMQARLILERPPPFRDGIIEIEGQDSDKMWAEPVPIEIHINRIKVYDGPNDFAKMNWSKRAWRIPKGVLRHGENTIRIRNNAATDSLVSHWFMLSECRVRFPRK